MIRTTSTPQMEITDNNHLTQATLHIYELSSAQNTVVESRNSSLIYKIVLFFLVKDRNFKFGFDQTAISVEFRYRANRPKLIQFLAETYRNLLAKLTKVGGFRQKV